MFKKIILTFAIIPASLLAPILEIGPTHVFNPDWPGHARLHEVWQLFEHVSLGCLCLYLSWRKNEIFIPSLMGFLIYSSFLVSVFLSRFYDGTMRHTDGTEIAINGINIAVLIMAISTLGFCYLVLSSLKAKAK